MAAGLALPLALLFSRGLDRRSVTDDLLLAVYFVVISAGFTALGFVLATAPSSTWRRLAPARAAIVAGVLGLVAPVASLLVTAAIATIVLPLFRRAPWLAITLFQGLPGVVLGAAAVLVARVWRTAA